MRYFYFNPPVSGKRCVLYRINWIPKISTHSIQNLIDVKVKIIPISLLSQRGGVAKSSNQMIERTPCSSSTNKKSSVFLFQENLLDFGVL